MKEVRLNKGILGGRDYYKPFAYPEAFQFYDAQQRMHWLANEVPMHNDVKDLKRLSERDLNLIMNVQRFFTQSDVDVGEAYMMKYGPMLGGHPEVRMMLAAFANMEAVHAHAYSLWLDTIGAPEEEFRAFADYEEMAAKHAFVSQYNPENLDEMMETLAVYSAFTEGMQLFSAFVMLLHFSHNRGLMKGMGQVVAYSIRDESLHVEGMTWLFRKLVEENYGGVLPEKLKASISRALAIMIELEDAFIDRAFSLGDIEGLKSEDVKEYIRWIADMRLGQLGMPPVYNVLKNPLPWVEDALNSVEYANFFEAHATEYQQGGLMGNFNKAVWGN